jgi:tetraacyldisaccharide 4'-kinase
MVRLWNNKIGSIGLLPFSWMYGLIVFIRDRLFQWHILSTNRLPVKVICIGNITVGGTGKTPFVVYCAQLLQNKGFMVGVLSRGYGRKAKNSVVITDAMNGMGSLEETGDEPVLLARRLKSIPIAIGKNRTETGRHLHESFGCDVLLLDDGFQHRKLHRDLDIVLIDASNPWGNGRLLPAGPLRESLNHLPRADRIVLTRTDESKTLNQLIQTIKKYTSVPIFTSIHQPLEWITLPGQQSRDLDFLEGKRVLAFSGIGNPDSFKKMLHHLGVSIADFLHFRDHHWYTSQEIECIVRRARKNSTDAIVTTEKDAVRISLISDWEIPALFLKIECKLVERQDELLRTLLSILEKPTAIRHPGDETSI